MKKKYICLKKYFSNLNVSDLILLLKTNKEVIDNDIQKEDRVIWALFKARFLYDQYYRSVNIAPNDESLWGFSNHLYMISPGVVKFKLRYTNVWTEKSWFCCLTEEDKKLITNIEYYEDSYSKYDLNIFKRDALPYLTKKDFPNLVKLTVGIHNMLE